MNFFNRKSKIKESEDKMSALRCEAYHYKSLCNSITSDLEKEREERLQIIDVLTDRDTKKLGFATAKLIRDMQSDISEYRRGILDLTAYLLNEKGQNMSIKNEHHEFEIIWEYVTSQRKELDKLKSQINEQ